MTSVLLEKQARKNPGVHKLLSYVRAPAKVNLTLNVLNKRPDGYHNIASLICFVDLNDDIALEYEPALDSITVSGPFADHVPHDDQNLAERALHHVVAENTGLHIRLTKFIPVAAGLGGGSADAAAGLR
ncbi:MAG: hypothetical protein AAF352_00830, partial [Pseudomonadota bacterium]